MTTNTGFDIFRSFLEIFDFEKSKFDTENDIYQYDDFELDDCNDEYIETAVMLILLNKGNKKYLDHLKNIFPNNKTSQENVMQYIIESHGLRKCKEHFNIFKITDKNRGFYISRCPRCISAYMKNK